MSTALALSTSSAVSHSDQLGDEIARLSAEVDVAIARLLALIREFDVQRGWSNGFRSCADWLAWRVGLDLGAAREKVRVARALGTLPLLSRALERGELTYTKVRALTRVATRESEARLLAIGRSATASHIERVVRGWRTTDRSVDRQNTRRRHESRAIHVYHDETGMLVIHGRLDPEAGALFMQALTAAQDGLYRRARKDTPVSLLSPRTPTGPQQRADALVLVAEAALHGELDPGAPGERYQVVVHVETPDLGSADQTPDSKLEDGNRVSAETSERLSCDAGRTVVRQDAEGRLVEVSARTRTVPPAMRRALLHRDHSCRFPGCELRFVQAHHIRHWSHGGPTTLSNLVLLCRYHHRAVHEEGFNVWRKPDGTLTFSQPDGQLLPTVPPPA